jgi:hypothetical protein
MLLGGAATLACHMGWGTRGKDELSTKMLMWRSSVLGKLMPCIHGDGGGARGQ